MKRILQKSLFRLRALLLLAVMFVVGSSAWAEQREVTLSFVGGNANPSEGPISAQAGWMDEWNGNVAGLYYNGPITVSSDNGNIVSVKFNISSSESSRWNEIYCEEGGLMSSPGIWEGDTETATFRIDSYSTIHVESIVVTYNEVVVSDPINYNIVMIDAPVGAAVTIDGHTFTKTESDNGEYTYPKAELFKKKHFSHNDVDGFWTEEATFVADYENAVCTYTVTYHPYYYYDVHITGGNGRGAINSSYRDGSVIESRTEMLENQFSAYEVNGWTAGDIDYVAAVPPTHGSVSVVYTENAPQVYTVEFVNAPAGATVTVNNEKVIARDDDDKTYTTTLTLESYDFRASNINGYDNEVTLNGLTATVTYIEWPKYHVVVTGDLADANAGVTYNSTPYHNDEYIVEKWFYESNLKVISFPYYEGSLTYDEGTKTITVNYTKVDYLSVTFSDVDNNYVNGPNTINFGDLTISGDYYNGSAFMTVSSQWNSYGMTITSSVFPIEKIEVFDQWDNSTEAIRINNAALNNNVWACGGNASNTLNVSSVYSAYGTFNYISKIRVWLAKPIEYTIKITGMPEGDDNYYVVANYDVYNGKFTTNGEHTYTTTDELNENSVNCAYPINPQTYKVDKTYDAETKTYDITYTALTQYNVVADGGNAYTGDGYVVRVNDAVNYKIGSTFYFDGTLEESNISIITQDGYTGTFVLDNNATPKTITVKYVEKEPEPVGQFAMSAAGWATLCVNYAFTLPEGYTAYTAGKVVNGQATLVEKDDDDKNQIILVKIERVPAYTPVLIYGPENAEVALLSTNNAVAPVVNYLQGNASDDAQTMYASGIADKGFGDYDWQNDVYEYGVIGSCQLYQLAMENDVVGFYRQVDGGAEISCAAHKAILAVPASAASSNARFVLPGQEEGALTGIDAIATEGAETIYNLQGQRVNATKAGVYVKNGRKVIVK